MKKCCDCKKWLPLSMFASNRAKKNGINTTCKPCVNRRCKEWYTKNRQRRIYKSMQYEKQYPERLVAYRRTKKLRHPAYYAAWQSEHAARKKRAVPKWFDPMPVRVMYEKARELSRNMGIEFHVDHIVPLTSEIVCGLHVHDNLQLLESSTNVIKGNREWPDMPEYIHGFAESDSMAGNPGAAGVAGGGGNPGVSGVAKSNGAGASR